MSLELFKTIFNKVKNINILQEEKSRLKPYGIVTIWEDEKIDKNIIFQDKNLIVNSFFDIMVGLFIPNSNKLITQLALGSGGVINSVLQTPNLNDTVLYTPLFVKTTYDSVVVEKITSKSISYNFSISKSEANGTGTQIYSELGLLSADGTMFARKTFQEIVKNSDKEFYIEWKLVF